MDISTVYEGSTATVAPVGHLNTNTSSELEKELAEVFANDLNGIVHRKNGCVCFQR